MPAQTGSQCVIATALWLFATEFTVMTIYAVGNHIQVIFNSSEPAIHLGLLCRPALTPIDAFSDIGRVGCRQVS